MDEKNNMQIRSLASSDSNQIRSFSSNPSSNPDSSCSSRSALSSSSYFAGAVLDGATINEDALLLATQRDSRDVVETLLKQMPAEQINRVHQRFHLNPLMVAVFENNMSLVQAFLKYPEIDLQKKSNYGDTALYLAVRARHIDIALEILNHPGLPDACHKEKLSEFSDLILENVKQKIESKYKILENKIDLCFDWLKIKQNIYEALQLYSQTGLEIRHDRCQIRLISDHIDQR
jgi:ankyrin repeat protein